MQTLVSESINVAIDQFWSNVKPPVGINGCWEWLGGKNNEGYGYFSPKHGTCIRAHRFAYELISGPIPAGLTIDHLCHNRACVNPYHLEPVSLRVNILRGEGVAAENARKTHCPKGHPLVKDNLKKRKNGVRACLTCARESDLAYYYRKRDRGVILP